MFDGRLGFVYTGTAIFRLSPRDRLGHRSNALKEWEEIIKPVVEKYCVWKTWTL